MADSKLERLTRLAALRRLRERARELVPDGEAVVAEFIAEKRREAEQEGRPIR